MAPDITEFAYEHLPQHMREASRPFAEIADSILRENEPGTQRDMALHYLLLAKDAAVRARKNSLHVYDVGTADHMVIVMATSPRDAMCQANDTLTRLIMADDGTTEDGGGAGAEVVDLQLTGVLNRLVSYTKLSLAEQARTVTKDVYDVVSEVTIRELAKEHGARPGVLWAGVRADNGLPVEAVEKEG